MDRNSIISLVLYHTKHTSVQTHMVALCSLSIENCIYCSHFFPNRLIYSVCGKHVLLFELVLLVLLFPRVPGVFAFSSCFALWSLTCACSAVFPSTCPFWKWIQAMKTDLSMYLCCCCSAWGDSIWGRRSLFSYWAGPDPERPKAKQKAGPIIH